MGKIQFHRKVEKIQKAKGHSFSKKSAFSQKELITENYLFMKLKQFKRSRELESIRKESSSEEEHKVNALAQGAEEGRDKLRKAAGSCK